ncbi:Short-chain dehydrogenase [Chitinophaga sp. YR627]|uniref:SDR family oxidoreductase n=1 Tax=Chitinophaga sp. YR627 TaxID=1881041 RepID=UPI0008F0E10C|nr:SDR family oxidoreductase [Chitinophaga sp. YR627]SFO86159.1 Short-chain dehydrogenase [Chitinophaga sp. YR627]
MNSKVVLITGTNSGFGYVTVKTLAALGHRVYATMRDIQGRNADQANELSAIPNVSVLEVNLTDDNSVNNAIDTVIAKESTIDILINNAGFSMVGFAESFTVTDVQELFDINVIAPWRLIKAILPAMRNQADGLIINITSGFGRFSSPFSTIYSATKFGLEGISEGLHYELRPLGVDVAIVEPGPFPTGMMNNIRYGSDQSVTPAYEYFAELPNKVGAAIGNLLQTVQPDPQEVADAINNLINLSKGQRPLRTVVDRATGEFVKAANDAVQVQYEKGLRAFGMGDLLISQ